MGTAWYQLFVLCNGKWELAKEGHMRKSAAEGLFNQFACSTRFGCSVALTSGSW